MSKDRPWTETAIDVVALYCPEESVALAELRADALALWAVRVLDAWADAKPDRAAFRTHRFDRKATFLCESPSASTKWWGRGDTQDAARLAAAEALAPELGDTCPKRPA